MDDRIDWLRFQSAFGYGSVRAQKILLQFHHPRHIFAMSNTQRGDLGFFTAAELRNLRGSTEEEAQKILDFCEDYGCDVLTPDDPGYPERLKNICDYPAVLYVRGSLGPIDEELTIAMVGTRNYTEYGERAARIISGELAARGAVIVSGMAKGIDTISHTAALKAGGKTIAVLGCGIDVVYPPQNQELEELIVKYGGAVVTEFPPGTQPLKPYFPIRNRIISGLSNGTVVVEGTRHSGSLITAGHALTQNRDVFAVPGSIFSPMSRGPLYLLNQGAKAVESIESILEEYELLIEKPTKAENSDIGFDTIEKTGYNEQEDKKKEQGKDREDATVKQTVLPAYLNETQQKIYNLLLGEAAVTSDYIATQSGFPVAAVLAALTQMEIFGLIKVLPGHRFSLAS